MGWPADLTVYKFLTDWGSFIGGGSALVAGVLVYIGARQAAAKQVAAVKDQIEDARAASRQADERRLSVIKWTVRAEVRRLEISVSALRRALPSEPQAANRLAEQLVIESSPLLTGEREEIALLDDKTRALLERLAGILDEYNRRIETAVVVGQGPLIDQEILALIDRLAEAVGEIRSSVL